MNVSDRSEAFLLCKTNSSALDLADALAGDTGIAWAQPVFGPFPVVAYLSATNRKDLTTSIESLRLRSEIHQLDARFCKFIPGDDELSAPETSQPERAVLLIGVDLSVAKEREVTYALRSLDQVVLARAMWGPDDIIIIIEESDRESMRNFICDVVKVTKGVKSVSTLYAY
ncbi:MAG: Lrp/AsnC ligand binding domain-containing protein [Verrucomicrobiota bacterium]